MIEFLVRAVPVVALLVLAGVLVYLVWGAFQEDNGVASLSAATLPILALVLTSFLSGKKTLSPFLELSTGLGATVASMLGFLAALLVHRMPRDKAPLAELLVSALFAWIASTWLVDQGNGHHTFVYSTSSLIGAAVYFIFWGRKR